MFILFQIWFYYFLVLFLGRCISQKLSTCWSSEHPTVHCSISGWHFLTEATHRQRLPGEPWKAASASCCASCASFAASTASIWWHWHNVSWQPKSNCVTIPRMRCWTGYPPWSCLWRGVQVQGTPCSLWQFFDNFVKSWLGNQLRCVALCKSDEKECTFLIRRDCSQTINRQNEQKHPG